MSPSPPGAGPGAGPCTTALCCWTPGSPMIRAWPRSPAARLRTFWSGRSCVRIHLRDNDMKYRKLGASDLEVSVISLGSWLTYGVGVEADSARACVERAFELGINFIDTANVYGRGAAQTFLGEALSGR